jgi:hypothetical protein
MPKRSPSSEATPPNQRPLPASENTQAMLLRSIEKVLEFLEPPLQGQRLRLRELRRTLDQPVRIVEQKPFLQAIAKANRERFAKGGPPMGAVMEYLARDKMARILAQHRSAQARLKARPPVKLGNLQEWKPHVDALEEVVEAEQGIVDLVRELQRRVIAALDERELSGADRKTDRTRPSAVRSPRNLKVIRLAHKIEDAARDGSSQREVALEFTNGNVKHAESLLRQIRRFGLVAKRRTR